MKTTSDSSKNTKGEKEGTPKKVNPKVGHSKDPVFLEEDKKKNKTK